MGWTSFFLSALKSGTSSTLKGGCSCSFRLRIFETVFMLKALSLSACYDNLLTFTTGKYSSYFSWRLGAPSIF